MVMKMKLSSKFPVVNPVFESEDTIQIRKIKESEYIRSQPPSESDIKKTKRFLKDFGMKKVVIPEFSSLAELLWWRRGIVFSYLDLYKDE
jgi:hypothetical protein